MMKFLVLHEFKKRDGSWKKFLTQDFTLEESTKSHIEDTSKIVGKDREGECSKESTKKAERHQNKKKKPSHEAKDVGPSTSKSVGKSDQRKKTKLRETPEPRVKRKNNIMTP